MNNITSLPIVKFIFSPDQKSYLTNVVLNSTAKDICNILLNDIESESQQLLSLHLVESILKSIENEGNKFKLSVENLNQSIVQAKNKLIEQAEKLKKSSKREWKLILRQRALLTLTRGVWLDYVSQPATEPANIICLLGGQNFHLKGSGEISQSQQQKFYRRFSQLGVDILGIYNKGILKNLQVNELTAWHVAFRLALSRLPASYLPEVVGFQYATYCLGFDDLLLDMPASLEMTSLEQLLDDYLNLCQHNKNGGNDIQRMLNAIQVVINFELEHCNMLLELQTNLSQKTLDDHIAEIIKQHMPFAGKQHQYINIEKRSLTQWAEQKQVDVFLNALKKSIYFKKNKYGKCGFMNAIQLGGAMFGIFNKREAGTLRCWSEESQTKVHLTNFKEEGHQSAECLRSQIRTLQLDDQVKWETAELPRNRELFYRLVNIERFANHLDIIKEQVYKRLKESKALFSIGEEGRYTDASYFVYSREALEKRCEEIYWTKLVQPYEKITNIPDRETVIFGQKLMALGSLIDGAWSHKFGGTLRYYRSSDEIMLSIYADEMGKGDIEKNHITLIQRVLKSMDIELPHIRDREFCKQDELPDSYEFSLHQLSMSLFPDTFYEELLGYNLGIEMFGLGEMRMHEIQKLRHYGFDAVYEKAHLTIDNFSAGHSRQSINLIHNYLDEISTLLSKDELQLRWNKIWNGYASFALFLETNLAKKHHENKSKHGELLI